MDGGRTEMYTSGTGGVDEGDEISDHDTLFDLSMSASSTVSSSGKASNALMKEPPACVPSEAGSRDLRCVETEDHPGSRTLTSAQGAHRKGLLVDRRENAFQVNDTDEQHPVIIRQKSPFRSITRQTDPCGDLFDVGHAQQPTLDLGSAMLSLIPSFPSWSVEIWLRAHRVMPVRGVDFTIPPYVRISLHPGGQTVACTKQFHRTGPENIEYTPVRDTPKTCAGNTRCANARSECVNNDDADCGNMVILKVGSEYISRLMKNDGPPTLKVELVSGRSVGHCDLSLSETLRRPGHYFLDLQVPIWEKVSRNSASKNDNFPQSDRVGEAEARGQASRLTKKTGRSAVANLAFELGVIQVGAGDHVLPVDVWTNRVPSFLNQSNITVEVLAVRGGADTLGSARDQVHPTGKRSGGIGVVVELAVAGERKYLDVLDSSQNFIEGRSNTPSMALLQETGNGSQVVLKSTCTELDILGLRLVTKTAQNVPLAGPKDHCYDRGHAGGSGLRCGPALMIPVSDINSIFDGQDIWIAMDAPGRNNATGLDVTNAAACATRGSGRSGMLEVNLRIMSSISDNQLEMNLDDRSRKRLQSSAKSREPHLQSPTSPPSLVHHFNPEFVPTTFPKWPHATVTYHEQNPHVFRTSLSVSQGYNAFLQPGPGSLELEIIAIQRRRPLQPAISSGSGAIGQIERQGSWRVRVEFTGGRNGRLTLQSPAGIIPTSSGAGQRAKHEGEEGEMGEGDRVRWPGSAGMRARYAIHWTSRRRTLPCALFSVLEEEVSTVLRSAVKDRAGFRPMGLCSLVQVLTTMNLVASYGLQDLNTNQYLKSPR